MESENNGKQLDERATRGASLTPEERKKVEEWYAAQDQVEMEELNFTGGADPDESIRSEVAATLRRIAAVTRSIQKTSKENNVLREEITTIALS